MFDGICVITLDRAPERWAHVQSVADRAGLGPLTRVRGVDGRALDPESIAALQHEGLLAADLSAFHTEARLGEIGCGLGHAAALREILAQQWRTALVLEDDVVLAGDAETWRARAEAAFADLPAKWDVWYLYRCFDIAHRTERLTPRTVVPYTPQGGAAYAVTARGAQRMLAAITPLARAVDSAYMELVRSRGVDAFAASPMLIDPGTMPSLINDDATARAWVEGGVNRPPEYWPEAFLEHLGELPPARHVFEAWWRAGRRLVRRVSGTGRGDTP
ncbi:MAG: glycosyltransferase family 25 protein [Gemmatimonadaceae bacterium]|nr:glycosyltransferase family 25 protein [Gemmatimonadaceae bacterium]